MPAARFLTQYDRAMRHHRIVKAYQRGGCSRSVASEFGLSDSHVRSILRLYGVARRRGRPAQCSA